MTDQKPPRAPRRPLPRFEELDDSAYCKASQIKGHVVPIGTVTMWRWVKEGRFPAPIRVGSGTYWQVGAIRAWLREQAARAGQRKAA
jgi:predicted DNA-binding transcriptional regulator AlpA